MHTSNKLKHRFVMAALSLLIALSTVVVATFAWYIYNTNAHTTNVHMAAGASSAIQIANDYNGDYGSATVLEAFVGSLNPVSTNQITGGFQKVRGYTNGQENQPALLANLFGESDYSDYYMTQLYLRTNGEAVQVYLSDIGYEDSTAENPISTAIRVGVVTHQAGVGQPVNGEYIFAINQAANPQAEYNTATGQAGYVLDAARTDGTTVPFTPYTSDNYCLYDREQGVVTLQDNSVAICEIAGDGAGGYGASVQLDIYIWLEGCDEDCTNNLSGTTLRNLALSFAGLAE